MNRGVTLAEVLVTLLLMALLAGITGVAVRSLDGAPYAEVIAQLGMTRRDAIISGKPQLWVQDSLVVRFLPDGSAYGDPIHSGGQLVVIDALTGGVRVVPQ